MKRALLLAASGLVALGITAAPAHSFDTSPHFDIIRDALGAEGFGTTATQVAQVNNWFVDLYENAEDNPYSGHSDFLRELVGGGFMDSEFWRDAVVRAADRSHFDSSNGGFPDALAVAREWERLKHAVYTSMRAAAAANDPARALTILGISLHEVQDFYAHTNWLEPKGISGYDGPGWQAQGYGTTPTWFDIPADVRLRERIYSGGSPGIPRSHGPWNAAVVDGLGNSMNKDWPGRPLYDEAYMAAYYASRQWVQAVRSWLKNESFWNRMRAYGDRHGGDLAHDVEGATDISFYSGHWQGQGEPGDPLFRFTAGPGGSLDDLAVAIQDYFEPGRTFFRRTFESTIEQVAAPSPPGALTNVPSSRPLQQNWRFVKAQILHMNEIDDMDVSFIDEADFYALAGIVGQRFRSAFIHGYDSYDFKRPNFPFTFVKAIRKGATYTEPLRDLRIKVATSNAGSSGTNDDVYLRINNNRRFLLDKPLYDDFESGDRDTYSLPIDALESAPTVSDVQFLQLEKSKDGLYGGWKPHGITVWINDRQVYNNLRIDTWLEDDHRTWRAPDFRPLTDTSRRLPIWLTLYDDDGFLYGDDDHVDLYPLHARKNVAIAYEPGQGRLEQSASGGDKYGGRWPSGDDDKGRIRYRIETLTPIPPP